MCGENFNTLKKGPHWTEVKQTTSPIEPPLEFQDRPKNLFPPPVVDFFCDRLTHQILKRVMLDFRDEGYGPDRYMLASYLCKSLLLLLIIIVDIILHINILYRRPPCRLELFITNNLRSALYPNFLRVSCGLRPR